MNYWIKNVFSGKIFKGKAEKWSDVSISDYGDRLYNPYTKQTVIGWNNYKKSLERSQNPKRPPGTKVIERKDRRVYLYPSGKSYTEYKSKSEIYGKAYDWRSDG